MDYTVDLKCGGRADIIVNFGIPYIVIAVRNCDGNIVDEHYMQGDDAAAFLTTADHGGYAAALDIHCEVA